MKLSRLLTLFAVVPLLSLAGCGNKRGDDPSNGNSNNNGVDTDTPSINEDNVITKIGDIANFDELYSGYLFESSNSFVGRVRADGVLETYRDGIFKLTGTKEGADPIFLEYTVKDSELINYPNFSENGVTTSGFLSTLGLFHGVSANTKERIMIDYKIDGEKYTLKDFIFEVEDETLATISEEGEFKTLMFKTTEKTGSTRLKVFLKDENDKKGKLLLDYYLTVNTPFEPGEIMEYMAGTSWTSLAFSGEQFFLNFIDNQTGSFKGYSTGKPIIPINFTYSVKPEYDFTFNEKRIKADAAGTNHSITLGAFYVSPVGNDLVLKESADGLAHIFIVDND